MGKRIISGWHTVRSSRIIDGERRVVTEEISVEVAIDERSIIEYVAEKVAKSKAGRSAQMSGRVKAKLVARRPA